VTGGVLLFLVAAELVWVDSTLVTRRTAGDLFADGWAIGNYLAKGTGRVYAPSFRPPPQVAAATGIRIVNGVDPLQPAYYAIFLSAAAGVPLGDEYSVTLPSLPVADNEEDGVDVPTALAGAEPLPWLLAVLDVDLVVSQFPIQSPSLTELFRHDREGLIVYRNGATVLWPAVFRRVVSVSNFEAALDWLSTGALSREAVVIGGSPLDGPSDYVSAELLLHRPNQLRIRADGPGLLVISELFHPGWKATVDGSPAEIVAADAVLRGVYLDEGEHEVEMVYRPVAVTFGAIVSGVALLVVLFVWWIGKS
jgi:hypothetical protein